eukprot:2999043-Prymnesium_polylepis.2
MRRSYVSSRLGGRTLRSTYAASDSRSKNRATGSSSISPNGAVPKTTANGCKPAGVSSRGSSSPSTALGAGLIAPLCCLRSASH